MDPEAEEDYSEDFYPEDSLEDAEYYQEGPQDYFPVSYDGTIPEYLDYTDNYTDQDPDGQYEQAEVPYQQDESSLESQFSDVVDEDKLVQKLDALHFFDRNDGGNIAESKRKVKMFQNFVEEYMLPKMTVKHLKDLGNEFLLKYEFLAKEEFIWKIKLNLTKPDLVCLLSKAIGTIMTKKFENI
ncbi:unnamed protein product [Moneuplotes crassus]|uniref:Uncharacterized protein n=1 Tax=Euplotes crassus TaxID=5936 RepID=A0AAD1Y1S1_EUPCR|nr:unnamed protein product [Moneuplotes crassus]